MIKLQNGTQRLLIKGNLKTLFLQCSSFINKQGEKQNLNEQLRENLWSWLIDVSTESTIPICICYKDLQADEIDQNDMFNDSGGMAEDQEEFLLR